MSGAGPIVGAGAVFAFTVLLGIGAGVWAQRATGNGLWVLAGLIGGVAIGGYSAVRLLFRSL